MYDKASLIEDVSEWVLDFVSVYNSELGSIPCPFAKKAMTDEKIYWSKVDNEKELVQTSLIAEAIFELDQEYEVMVIGIDPSAITKEELEECVLKLNQNILMPKGYIALEDHPDNAEIINEAKMNQGKWSLVFVQPTDKLSRASDMLKRQGYYDNWTQEQIDDVVSWRNNVSNIYALQKSEIIV